MPLVLLRVTLFLLPCLALALALPEVPHWFVVGGVLVGSAVWARTPDHAVGVDTVIGLHLLDRPGCGWRAARSPWCRCRWRGSRSGGSTRRWRRPGCGSRPVR